MEDEKLVEMTKDLALFFDQLYHEGVEPYEEITAEYLHNKGYRKQTECEWHLIEYEYFTCSECGEYYYNGSESTEETKRRIADGEYPNYCPNCGAKTKAR